jgi:glycosyltransferase involved in cell wall biosynthesis
MRMRMKVVYVLPISWGGIPHYTAELANAVANYADVIVIKPKDSNDNLFSEDVKVINAFKPLTFVRGREKEALSLCNLYRLLSYRNIRIIKELKPDVVHFPGMYAHTALFAKLTRLDRKNPVVCTEHSVADSYLVTPKNRGFFPTLLWVINNYFKSLIKPNKIVVHTINHRDLLIKKGVDAEKISVIPHGAFTLFKNHSNDIIENKGYCVLFFGYISKNKGIEYLIKAVPIVSKEIPNIKLIIAGEGDFSTYLKYIEDKSKFEIYNEFIPNEKVYELFQRAKFVVLPYTYQQGHSGVLTVAFSFGKAVIVTNVGDLPNLVEDGKEGLVVPPRDPEALADAIITLLKDDELRKKMGENAYKKVQELSWDTIAKKHIEVYEEVLE